MQAVGDTHETPLSGDAVAPWGVGTLSIDQVDPSSFSTSGFVGAPILVVAPTATHACDEVHDTAFSELVGESAGMGVIWTLQVLPVHASASGLILPYLSVYDPTAMQLVDEAQDIPFSSAVFTPAGTGAWWIDHFEPFHCSTSGTVWPVRWSI